MGCVEGNRFVRGVGGYCEQALYTVAAHTLLSCVLIFRKYLAVYKRIVLIYMMLYKSCTIYTYSLYPPT